MIIDSSIKLDSIPLQHQNIKQRHLLACTRVHRTPRVQRHTKHIFLEAKKLFFIGRTEFSTLNRSRKQCNFYVGSTHSCQEQNLLPLRCRVFLSSHLTPQIYRQEQSQTEKGKVENKI